MNLTLVLITLATLILAAAAHAKTRPAEHGEWNPPARIHIPAAKQAWQYRYRIWMPEVWRAIIQCETQSNFQHNSGTYQGAFGFYHGSWDAFRPKGYPSEAYLATPWQQYRVALRIYARYRFTGWGCYTHGGYRYWMGRV
jgi:hypothetical protein